MAEQEFYNDGSISVTSARFITGNQTFAMSGVTSVRTLKTKPSRKGPIIIGILGLISLLIGEVITLLIGLALIGLAIFWFIKQKPTYLIKLVTSSGESDAYFSTDEVTINKIVSAINEAIIARG